MNHPRQHAFPGPAFSANHHGHIAVGDLPRKADGPLHGRTGSVQVGRRAELAHPVAPPTVLQCPHIGHLFDGHRDLRRREKLAQVIGTPRFIDSTAVSTDAYAVTTMIFSQGLAARSRGIRSSAVLISKQEIHKCQIK